MMCMSSSQALAVREMASDLTLEYFGFGKFSGYNVPKTSATGPGSSHPLMSEFSDHVKLVLEHDDEFTALK